MKFTFSIQTNNNYQPQKQRMAFGAGLTSAMQQEIRHTDILAVSQKLAQRGIPSNFRGDKRVAWFSGKIIDIVQQFRRFRIKSPILKGLGVEDFVYLHTHPDAFGTCTLLPYRLKRNSEEVIPENTIFFNSRINWDNMDALADDNFANGMISSNFFLALPVHELSHAIHLSNIRRQIQNGNAFAARVESAKAEEYITEYQRKYGPKVSSICSQAVKNPFEAIAWDMSRTIVDALDKDTLTLTRNPFIGTPYENPPFWQRKRTNILDCSDLERPLPEILRRFWNGKFE